jgi:hypothetical protein
MSQYPHYPTGYEDSANEHGKAVQAIANLFTGSTTLGDTEHHRSKQAEQDSGTEMGEL